MQAINEQKTHRDARDEFPFLTEKEAKHIIFYETDYKPWINEEIVKQARAKSASTDCLVGTELRILINRKRFGSFPNTFHANTPITLCPDKH